MKQNMFENFSSNLAGENNGLHSLLPPPPPHESKTCPPSPSTIRACYIQNKSNKTKPTIIIIIKAMVTFKSKLSTPCRKLLILLKLKKPLYTRSIATPPRPSHVSKKTHVCALFPTFRIRKKSKQIMELKPATEAIHEKALHNSSEKSGGRGKDNVVEEACRSFEKYLLEMIVEEGNVKDLMDVEELLYCWKNLKSPVFVELVSRFYGELCKDLFSPEDS